MDSTASNPTAPYVDNQKISSDWRTTDHAMNPRSDKEGMLPEPSITVEQEVPKGGPNLVPAPPITDPRLKRLLANRESAKRSRLRKLEYMENLKREKDIQQARVNWLKPQVSSLEDHRKDLTSDNNAIKERMAALEIQKTAQEAEYRALLEERSALMAVIMRHTRI